MIIRLLDCVLFFSLTFTVVQHPLPWIFAGAFTSLILESSVTELPLKLSNKERLLLLNITIPSKISIFEDIFSSFATKIYTLFQNPKYFLRKMLKC